MSRDMTITVTCDTCHKEIDVDLESGNVYESYDERIETELERNGWYTNLDGDYCFNCAEKAKVRWKGPVTRGPD